jgi:hypothetical protein
MEQNLENEILSGNAVKPYGDTEKNRINVVYALGYGGLLLSTAIGVKRIVMTDKTGKEE